MTITHHLDDATIVGLASGSLPSAFAVVASAHAEMCPHCRKRLRAAQAVGGAFLDAVDPVPLSDAATHNLLERIGASAPQPEPALPPSTETGLPSPVGDFSDELKNQEGIARPVRCLGQDRVDASNA